MESPDRGDSARFRLKDNISLHLYTSSQPCGNATIKRWAKSGKERFQEELKDRWEMAPHPKLQILARSEGQVALLCKRDPLVAQELEDQEDEEDGARKDSSSKKASSIAPGTALPGQGKGFAMTCSDKIARWNALGLQGGLLANLVEPIFLTSCTVGRKFSRLHCMRALCCRLQDFTREKNEHLRSLSSDYGIRHLSLMCTAIKFDNGVYTGEGSGASFSDDLCLAWCSGDETAESLNGRSGFTSGSQETASRFSKVELFKIFMDIHTRICTSSNAGDQGGPMTYSQAKSHALEYRKARSALLEDPKLFLGWISSEPELEAFSCQLRC
mmetsp:Transcript_24017/g.37668  ORF Transcript_24017/g.37668 Transcript_24017/m.37668 type:complete len:328 (+) Transcript_24017:461-1444(+)